MPFSPDGDPDPDPMMINMPSISVVIPAYNAAWSIGETLRSVLAQSCPAAEIIIVDDGSTDALHQAVAAVSGRQSAVRIVSQENRGLAAARNRGIREASSPLLALLDSDDLWHADYLQKVAGALVAAPDAPFAYSYSLRVDAANRVIPSAPWPRAPRHDFAGLFVLNSVGNGSAAVFRRDLLIKHGGFDEGLRTRASEGAEDWKLVLALSQSAIPVLVPEYLVAYRLIARSMSQSNPEKQYRAICAVLDEVCAEMPDARKHARNARTMMIGWLAPAFFRKRKFVRLSCLLARAYLLNPLWFCSSDLRMLHIMKLKSMAQSIKNVLKPGTNHLRNSDGFDYLRDI